MFRRHSQAGVGTIEFYQKMSFLSGDLLDTSNLNSVQINVKNNNTCCP